MPNQRKSKGGKHQRGKKELLTTRELIYKLDDQMYGVVTKLLGTGRFTCMCDDHKARLCHLRGSMYKKVWINLGDTVLMSIRQFEPDKGDIILKYTPDETRRLRALKEIPEGMGADDDASGDVEFIDEN